MPVDEPDLQDMRMPHYNPFTHCFILFALLGGCSIQTVQKFPSGDDTRVDRGDSNTTGDGSGDSMVTGDGSGDSMVTGDGSGDSMVTDGVILPVNSTTGDDALTKQQIIDANGTLAWRTLGRAVWGDTIRANATSAEAVAAGEIVEIQDSEIYQYSAAGIGGGHYPFALFATVNSGTAQEPIVIRGATGEFPTLQVEPETGDAAVIGRDQDFETNYIRYENLKARDAATVTNDGNDVFRNEFGLFRPQGGTGIVAHRVELQGQTRDYNGVPGVNYAAIRWDNSTDCAFSNGKIHGFHTVDQFRAIACDTYGGSAIRMFQNTIWDMDSGILIKERSNNAASDNNSFYRNLVFDTIKSCFSASRSDGNQPSYVFQNVFIGGAAVVSIDGSAAFGNVIYANNTWIDPTGNQGVLNIYNWPSAGDANHSTPIRNNIFVAAGNEMMLNMARSTALDGTTPAAMTAENIDFDGNIYFRVDGAAPRWSFRGEQQNSLAEWRSAISNAATCPVLGEGRDCSSQATDPQFSSYKSSVDFNADGVPENVVGYRLGTPSPATNAGINVIPQLATEYDIALGQPITVGAYIEGNEQIGADW